MKFIFSSSSHPVEQKQGHLATNNAHTLGIRPVLNRGGQILYIHLKTPEQDTFFAQRPFSDLRDVSSIFRLVHGLLQSPCPP